MNTKKIFLGEFIGTAALLIVVVGSGIMAERLSQGNDGLALLANSLATGAGLFALINCFAGISGAHFNPVVTLIAKLNRSVTTNELYVYVFAQVSGAIIGVFLSHAMFDLPILQLSEKSRGEPALLLSEFIATFGLITVIGLTSRFKEAATPASVSLYIVAAYWCTSSTSFANPAVTIARSLTNTFTGVLWTGMPAFIGAQLLGAAIAYLFLRALRN